MEIYLFRSEAAIASHLDSKVLSGSWVTSLPHSTQNLKKKKGFGFCPSSLFGADIFLRHLAGPGAHTPCCQSVAVVPKANFGDIWRFFL